MLILASETNNNVTFPTCTFFRFDRTCGSQEDGLDRMGVLRFGRQEDEIFGQLTSGSSEIITNLAIVR